MKRLVLVALSAALAAPAFGDVQTVPLAQRSSGVFDVNPAAPTRVHLFSVVSATRLVVDVRSESGPVAVALVDPLGAPRDPASFEQFTIDASAAPPLGAVVFEAGHHVQTVIDAPAPGTWTLTVSLPPGGTPTLGSITTVATGGVGVAATTSRPYYPVGQPVTLALVAFDGPAPVTGAAVTAGVYQTGGESSPMPVTLRDDGDAPDTAAGDGVYTAAIDGLSPGHYLAEVVAVIGAGRAVAGADFEVVPSRATFGTPRTDAGVDTNGDGLFDLVRLAFPVQVDTPGVYEVVAELRTAAGAALRSGARATLAAGPGQVLVPFAAADLRKYLAADGPWLVRDVRLLRVPASLDEGDLLADRVDDFGATGAYLLGQLQRPITVINPGIVEQAIDDDGDGLFDLLPVSFGVDTLRSGFYTWTGDLRAPDGTVLGVASGQGFLSAGVTSVGFTFQGQPIGASGLDGPYTVGNAAVYGPFNAAAVTDTVGVTRAYLSAQFEGGEVTFARLILEVRQLVITGPGGIPRAQGIRTSLLHKAENARDRAEAGQGNAAANLLEAFNHEVRALTGVHIAPADAERLLTLTSQLLALL